MTICKRCQIQRAESDFRKTGDGSYEWRERVCRHCQNERRCQQRRKNPERYNSVKRAYYAKNAEKYRIIDRRRYYNDENRRRYNIDGAKCRSGRTETIRAWRKNNPEKYRAQTALGNAVRDGKVFKPDRCSRCATVGYVVGHHFDYCRPLDVIWLCPSCHGLEHRIGLPDVKKKLPAEAMQ